MSLSHTGTRVYEVICNTASPDIPMTMTFHIMWDGSYYEFNALYRLINGKIVMYVSSKYGKVDVRDLKELSNVYMYHPTPLY